jgi:glycerol-3-phosphate dehydrogenase
VVRDLARLTSHPFDIVVVGGGIHGLAAAYDAASRGFTVAVLERGDFGHASSFNHLKTVHGGLRSLQSADLVKFRQGVHERRAMGRIAPHLVEPLAFLLPTLPTLTRSRPALRAAFLLDAVLAADRNAGLPPRLHLPGGQVISRRDALDRCPLWTGTRVTGAARWYDYQMPRTERLTLAFAHAASRYGAVVANYVEARTPMAAGGRFTGIAAADVETGASLEIRARALVNCAGASAPALAQALGLATPWPLQKALNLVTTRRWSGAACGAALHGGTLFLVPWEGRLVVGTWHDDVEQDPSDGGVSRDQFSRCLADTNAAFPGLDLRAGEVSMVHRGLVPGVRRPGGTVEMQPRGSLVDHAPTGFAGAVSLVAVKYTTARGVAERAVNVIARHLDRGDAACVTATTRLPGADLESIPGEVAALRAAHPSLDAESAEHLVRSYGTGWRQVVPPGETEGTRLSRITPDHPAVAAEVRHAVREEVARTLVDVVVRRLRLGVAAHPGEPAAAAAAAIQARESGWDAQRVARELDALRAFYLPVTRTGLGLS